MSSTMRSQRQEWIDFLDADPFFDGIPLLSENKKEITSDINKALGPLNSKGGKTGIVAVFMSVTAGATDDGGNGPVIELLHVVRILENPTVNSTGTNYEEVAEKIAALTHGNFKPANGNSPFVLDPPGIALGNDPKWPSKDVFFRCTGNLGQQMDQVEPVTIETNEITPGVFDVTLACATSHAVIVYSTGNAAPSPRNAIADDASFYDGTISAVAAGTVIKARAWLAGLLASEILKTTL